MIGLIQIYFITINLKIQTTTYPSCIISSFNTFYTSEVKVLNSIIKSYFCSLNDNVRFIKAAGSEQAKESRRIRDRLELSGGEKVIGSKRYQ